MEGWGATALFLNKEIKTNICKPRLSPRAERMCQIGKQGGDGGDCGKPERSSRLLKNVLLSNFGRPGNFSGRS